MTRVPAPDSNYTYRTRRFGYCTVTIIVRQQGIESGDFLASNHARRNLGGFFFFFGFFSFRSRRSRTGRFYGATGISNGNHSTSVPSTFAKTTFPPGSPKTKRSKSVFARSRRTAVRRVPAGNRKRKHVRDLHAITDGAREKIADFDTLAILDAEARCRGYIIHTRLVKMLQRIREFQRSIAKNCGE